MCNTMLSGLRAPAHTWLAVPRAHDCITFFLGSRKRYNEFFVEYSGCYRTSGWLAHREPTHDGGDREATAMSCRVRLSPEGTETEVPSGTVLLDAVARMGVQITAPCGGGGTCGKCRVEVLSGDGVEAPLAGEQALLTEAQRDRGVRLACVARALEGAVELTVPAASRAAALRILPAGVRRQVNLEPAARKVAVALPQQTLEEPHARLEELRRAGDLRADLRADLTLLRRLPELLPYEAETVTAVMRDDELLDVEPGDTSARCFGLALDLGTTTVVAALVDLGSGNTLGHGVSVNHQSEFGHDVIARIQLCLEQEDGLEKLRAAALRSLHQAIDQVLENEGVDRSQVYEATLVGNTTMAHLCLGISPASMGTLPYAATVGDAVDTTAVQIGLSLNPRARVYVLPNIGAFVGADTVGAVLATSMDEEGDGRVRLLADIGTNCELALRRGERLLVTSTPAGPAFEGARISCGMYAVPGAIESVRMDIDTGAVECKVIGGGPAAGLCGSGLVDAAAELLRVGLVDETGRMLGAEEDNPMTAHMTEVDGAAAFVLATTEAGETIVLTQRDLRELQLAKGAIRSAIDILLDQAGVAVDEVDEFCIAGGFGSYLDKGSAMRLGLIPTVPAERIRYVGNGALVGACLALVSNDLRRGGDLLPQHAEHLQIAGTPDFQMRFSEAMLFEAGGGDAQSP